MNQHKSLLIAIFASAIILAAVVLITRAEQKSGGELKRQSAVSAGSLSAEENYFDFGSISMAKGNASHVFKIKNTGNEPVAIDSIYTSCMCTNASFIKGNERFGPFGMPGHGSVPRINQSLNPGETAEVEAVFDPAAHGPAGVGKVSRQIIIENNAGNPLEFNFDALVTP